MKGILDVSKTKNHFTIDSKIKILKEIDQLKGEKQEKILKKYNINTAYICKWRKMLKNVKEHINKKTKK